MARLLIFALLLTSTMCAAMEHTPWKLEGAQERIEKYRKGDCELQLVLPDGSMLPEGVEIDMKQTDHAFHFGGSFCQGRRLFSHQSFPKYSEHFADLFNYATLGFYWVLHEKTPGTWKLDSNTEKVMRFAIDRGMRVRGHPLMWHNAIPDFIEDSKLPGEKLDPIINDHIRRLVRDYPQIDEWDLYNEPPGIRLKDESNGARRWVEWQGGPSRMIERMVDTVRAVEPDGRFIVNHFSHSDPEYHELIEYLLEKDVSFDAIGIQAHMHTHPEIWTEDEMVKSLERYSKYDKPLQITELSIVSTPPLEDWKEMQAWEKRRERNRRLSRKSTRKMEAYQAAYARDFYTLAFSYPDIEAIVWWSVSDVDIWRGIPSGLVDLDGNPKPAYHVLHELINEEWQTNLQVPVDAGGRAAFRGFYGSYELQVRHGGRTLKGAFDLEPGEDGAVRVLLGR